jgi:dolichol-phosphate mannosyltransferase
LPIAIGPEKDLSSGTHGPIFLLCSIFVLNYREQRACRQKRKGIVLMGGVSIIIPTRNEAENIDFLLQRIFKVVLPEGIFREIIFVDDSSTDETRPQVLKWSQSHPEVKLVCRDSNAGLASAVIEGSHQATYDVVMVMDADLSHPPEKIPEMIAPLLSGSHQMVIGSRYVKGGETPEWPFARKLASKIATVPARLFTDVNDPMAGFFATTRDRLTSLRPDVPGFKIGLEVLAVGGSDLNILEIPIVFHDRFEGFSKMNKKIIFEYLKQVMQLAGYDHDVFTPLNLAILAGLGLFVSVCLMAAGLMSGLQHTTAHLLAGTGGCLTLFFLGLKFWQREDHTRKVNYWQAADGLVVLVLSLSFQGAASQLVQSSTSASDLLAYLPGALLATLFSLTIFSVYTFSGLKQAAKPVQLRVFAIGTILAVLLLRLMYLGVPELLEQEAYYWNYAQHLDYSYLDHPPMVALLIWLGTSISGTSEFGVRIGAFICWFITAYFSYQLSFRMFGRTAALGAVLLLSVLPLYYGAGFIMTPDAPLHAAWAALLYFLYRALVDCRSEAWLWIGVSLGLGMISKYTIVLLAPAVICFMLVDRKSRPWFVRSEPYGAALLALFIFSPVLFWNFQHEWASFLFQGGQRVTGRTFFTTHRLLGYIALIMTPAGVLGILYYLFRGNRFTKNLVVTGKEMGRRFLDRGYLFTFLMIMSPLSVFFIFSLTKEVKLNWTSPLWLAVLPFLGCTVMAVFPQGNSRYLSLLHKMWKTTIVVLLLGLAIAFHYVTIGLPMVPDPPGPFLIGWEDFARRIEGVVDQTEKDTGRRPVVVGMDKYQIASGLAFYRTKGALKENPERRKRGVEETLGWHLFGWNSLMYDYWAEPEKFYGRDILAVGSSKIRVEYPYYQNHMISMNNILPLDAKKNGIPVRRFYGRLVKGYRPVDK